MQKAHKKLESYFKGKKLFVLSLKAFILLSPLPFGGVPRVFAPMFYICLLLLGFLGYRQRFHQREIVGERLILRAGLLTGGFFLLQLIPLPLVLLRVISPNTVATLTRLRETAPAFHPISLVPFQTLETLMQFMAMTFILWILMHVNVRRRDMMGILYTIVYSGVFQVLFGLAKYFSGNRKFFLLFHTQKQDVYSSYLTGTIGNPNHFAFYLELVLPVALAVLFIQVDALKRFPSFQERMHQAVDFKNKSFFYLGAVLLCGVGILLTGSRAGVVTTALSLLVFVQLSVYLAGKQDIRRRLKWIFISIVLLASIVGIQNTIAKFMTSPLHAGGRMTRWPDSLKMALDYPIAGTGFGTYNYAFFLYDSDGVKWSTHAHNDYLEVLTDGGAIGGMVFLFFVWSLVNAYVRRWWERRHPQIKLIGIGILTAFFAALFHSLFDFSMRIPANLFLATVLIGIGINLMAYRRDQSPTLQPPKRSVAVTSVMGIVVVFFCLQLVSHLFLTLGQRSPSMGRMFLKWSTLAMPLDPDAHLEYGYRLLQDNETQSDRQLLLKGIGALERAATFNMLHYNAHYFLAKGFLFADQPGEPYFDRAVRSFKRAGYLRAKNPDISLDTLKVYMSLWNLLGNHDREFVGELFSSALGQFDSRQVGELLELWGLYIKDIEFLEQGLRQHPHFYLEAAQKLTELEIDLARRQLFLAHYEAYWLSYSQQKLAGLLSLKNAPLSDLEMFFRRFSNYIVGYHRFIPEARFDRDNYLNLKRRLYLTIIQALLSREDGFKYLERQEKIVQLVSGYVKAFPSEDHLHELMILLEKHRFFLRSGLQGREIRLSILNRMEKYGQLISEGIELTESISFVTSDQEDFYAGILLLLSDAYMESGNYYEALNMLELARPFGSRKNELFWRLGKLERIAKYGSLPDPLEGTLRLDPSRERIDAENRDTRIIPVNGLRTSARVYPFQDGTIEIHAGQRLGSKLAGKHVVQVLVDGELAAEQYLGIWLRDSLIVTLNPSSLGNILTVEIKVN